MSAQQVSPLDIATKLAATGRSDPGIAQFLTDGSYSALSPNAQQVVARLLRGTPWQDQPGRFYLDWHAASQQQAQQQQAAGYSPTREIYNN